MHERSVRTDPTARLSPERLDALLALHGVAPDPRWRELEERVGGVSFGEGYRAVRLGFRGASREGQVLLEIASQGDTHYYVSLGGEAFARDHVAEREPGRVAGSLAELAHRLGWPIVDALLPTGATRSQLAAAERASARHVRVELAEARARLDPTSGAVTAALAFEELLGGVVVGDWQLGLDTHRTHPPRDRYDEWLSRDLQRALVQIAFGGPGRATYWLDALGCVHEIAPLDRLRPVAARLDEFLAGVLEARWPGTHYAVVAIERCDPSDATTIFGPAEDSPIGPHPVLWSAHALRFLEERDELARDALVVSAPRREVLEPMLAALVDLVPGARITRIDGG